MVVTLSLTHANYDEKRPPKHGISQTPPKIVHFFELQNNLAKYWVIWRDFVGQFGGVSLGNLAEKLSIICLLEISHESKPDLANFFWRKDFLKGRKDFFFRRFMEYRRGERDGVASFRFVLSR